MTPHMRLNFIKINRLCVILLLLYNMNRYGTSEGCSSRLQSNINNYLLITPKTFNSKFNLRLC